MSKPPLFFVAVIALIAVLATRQYLNKRRQDADNDHQPVRSLQVEVSAKREFPSPDRRSRQREDIVVEDMRYEVYFRPLAGGSEIKVPLPQQIYHQIDKGEKGTLRLQGTRFISFMAVGAPHAAPD